MLVGVAEAINITRATDAKGSLKGINSLYRGNAKVSENTPLGNFEILITEKAKDIGDLRLLIGIDDKKIVMEATYPKSGIILPINRVK